MKRVAGLLALALVCGACSGSGQAKPTTTTQAHAAPVNLGGTTQTATGGTCGMFLLAHWENQSLPLTRCGSLGVPDARVDLHVGEELVIDGAEIPASPKLEPRSTDPKVLASEPPPASAVARFRAVNQGSVQVVTPTPVCLQHPGDASDCTIVTVVIQ